MTRAQVAALLDQLAKTEAGAEELAARRAEAYAEGYRDGVMDRTARGRRRGEAAQWIVSTLADGPRATTTLKGAALKAGHSWETVERASRQLGVIKAPQGSRQPWVWQLPESVKSAKSVK